MARTMHVTKVPAEVAPGNVGLSLFCSIGVTAHRCLFSPLISCCQGIVSIEVCYCGGHKVRNTGFRQFHYVLWKPDFPKASIS